jgi:predicted ATPase/DNA-binding SARP family transcriptional activator
MRMEGELEFAVLGPFEVRSRGSPLKLASAKQRALLAVLLLHANKVVSNDRLIDELWPQKAPESTTNVLQVHVSQLRKLLAAGGARTEAGPLLTRAPGYVLRVDPDCIDSVRFERLLDEGIRARAAKEAERAYVTLQEGLALWRGPALADFSFEGFARAESARLEELHLLAMEERVEAALDLGRHAALVGELEALVAQHPLRERLIGQLMLALYRSRRQAEALNAYSNARKRLVEELGIEPSTTLQRLERAILNQDPSLDLAEPAPRPREPQVPEMPAETALVAATRPSRKTVTVVFAEWALAPSRSSTIDPETLDPVLGRLVQSLASVVERHGGSVQWSREVETISVFGLPRVHEDDALRGVRAAVELRDEVAALGALLESDFGVRVGVRIGLNTGNVVAGAPFASPSTGGASSVAARLGRSAEIGEIYLAGTTHELLRDAVEAEPLEIGGAEATWRLLAVLAGAGGARTLSDAMVGRSGELETLRRVYESIESERRASLVTVLGPAGIGKSHLARAFVTGLGDRCRVLVGRCLAYGEGSTFAPLAEIVRKLDPSEPLRTVRELVNAEEDRDLIAERVGRAIGLSDAGGGSETTFWAVRKLFEALAREKPLVLGFDDLHWAAPAFLDLVEYLVDWTFDAPVLLLGLGRPDLLDQRPSWAGGKRSVSSLLLDPLTEAESRALLAGLAGGAGLDAKQTSRIAEAAAGNPLFIEQLVAMLASEPSDAEIVMPPSIQALLAARLDSLDPDHRSVLEQAAVIGKVFWRGALSELDAEDDSVSLGTSLQALVRQQLIEPCRSALPAGDALRFHSVLIRDAAYDSVPKRSRAVLHEQVAAWLERTAGGQATQYEEVLGYHLEQAFRYARELGPADDHVQVVGRNGARYLASAGRRAFASGDMSAAAGLLRRAAGLLPQDDLARLELLPVAGEALHEIGQFDAARAILAEAIRVGETVGDECVVAKARLVLALVEASTGGEEPGDAFVAQAKDSAALFERAADDEGLTMAFRMLAWAYGTAGRYGDAADAAERAVDHAGRAGDERQRARAASQYALAALHGSTRVTEAIERSRQILDEVAGDRRSEGLLTSILGWLEAMRGDFDLARTLAARARAMLVDLGTSVLAASTSQEASQIEMLAGDPVSAERDLRRDYDALAVLGEKYLLSTVAGELAQTVYAQGRFDEALEHSRVAEELAAPDDVTSQAFWRSVRAKVCAREGRLEEALPLAREAVQLLRRTEDLVALARALVDLAEVQAIAERQSEARGSLDEAVRLLERKENVVGARRARLLLESLTANPSGIGSSP